MEVEAYVARHAPEWDRLSELVRPRWGRARLTGAEIDELVELYQRVQTHLSVVRAGLADPVLEARLSALVAQARSVVSGASTPVWEQLGRFVVETFPAAVYRTRWVSLGVAVACVGVALLIGWRIATMPELRDALLSQEGVRQLVQHDFEAYYSENPAGDFFLAVWLNNAKVAAACLVMGVVVLPLLNVLYATMANVGVIGGVMVAYDRPEVFFGLLLTHGLLELSCVFVAAAAGLRLAWAWIAPGRRTRGQAMAAEGRAGGALALGLAGVLMISACLEAFVTPAPWPIPLRLALGALIWAALVGYVVVLGRRAVRAGVTGDVAEAECTEVPYEAA